MNWAARFSWLMALRRGSAAGAGDEDRGDMGTAFGLDASFGRSDMPPPPEPTDQGATPPWSNRLVRRSGL